MKLPQVQLLAYGTSLGALQIIFKCNLEYNEVLLTVLLQMWTLDSMVSLFCNSSF